MDIRIAKPCTQPAYTQAMHHVHEHFASSQSVHCVMQWTKCTNILATEIIQMFVSSICLTRSASQSKPGRAEPRQSPKAPTSARKLVEPMPRHKLKLTAHTNFKCISASYKFQVTSAHAGPLFWAAHKRKKAPVATFQVKDDDDAALARALGRRRRATQLHGRQRAPLPQEYVLVCLMYISISVALMM